MSKKNRIHPKKQSLLEFPTAEKVHQNLADGHTQTALDIAKRYAKEHPGPEAEDLLSRAYQERIRDLQQSGAIHDAQRLIEVAQSRFPKHKDLFPAAIQDVYQFPLDPRDIPRVVQLLLHPDPEGTARQRAFTLIQTGLADPRHLLACPQLPADHPLRQEATLVWQAWEAAAGDLPEAERVRRLENLAQAGRRSPLVYWCYFIRALEAYYQRDDAAAREMLERIPRHTALAQAVYLLQCKLNHIPRPEGMTSHPTRDLWRQLSTDSPRAAWQDMMKAVRDRNRPLLREKVLDFLHGDELSPPYFARSVIRAIIEAMMLADIHDELVQLEMEKVLRKVWGPDGEMIMRLMIMDITARDSPMIAADNLNQLYRRYKDSLTPQEQAVILSRAAFHAHQDESHGDPYSIRLSKDLGMGIDMDPDEFDDYMDTLVDDEYDDDFDEGSYKRVAPLKTPPRRLFSSVLLERACELDPQPEYFESLIESLETEQVKPAEFEKWLLQWHEACPDRCDPLIRLFEATEKRGALQKSIKLLEKAERIDRLNPKVRNARYRLQWQAALKHLQQGRLQLAEKDLKPVESEELNLARRNLFEGIKQFLALGKGEEPLPPREELPPERVILFHHLSRATGMAPKRSHLEDQYPLPELSTAPLLKSYFDLREALAAVGDAPILPMDWSAQIGRWIEKVPGLPEELLLRIARAIHSDGTASFAKEAISRGLRDNGPRVHEFLYYRALALLKESPPRVRDAEDCVLAVITLCRARGDYELERQAVAVLKRTQRSGLMYLLGGRDSRESPIVELSERQIQAILQRERKRRALKSARSKESLRDRFNKFFNLIPKRKSKKAVKTAKRSKRVLKSPPVGNFMDAPEEENPGTPAAPKEKKPKPPADEDDDQLTLW
ncbi:MAG: hypothetical protein ACE15F_17880 [bacterium]